MNKTLLIILVIIIILGAYAWSFYNGLVKQSQAITAQWAQVENQFQRRYDLIPNLVASVQGAMSQEQKVFSDITNIFFDIRQICPDRDYCCPFR